MDDLQELRCFRAGAATSPASEVALEATKQRQRGHQKVAKAGACGHDDGLHRFAIHPQGFQKAPWLGARIDPLEPRILVKASDQFDLQQDAWGMTGVLLGERGLERK
jgi:hypothetical protein